MRVLHVINGEFYSGAVRCAWRSLCLNEFRRSAIFSVEPWFTTQPFHWLPKLWRVSLLRRFELGHWARASCIDEAVVIVNGARLLHRRILKARFPGELVVTERHFRLPKLHALHSVQSTDVKVGGRGSEAPDFQAGSR